MPAVVVGVAVLLLGLTSCATLSPGDVVRGGSAAGSSKDPLREIDGTEQWSRDWRWLRRMKRLDAKKRRRLMRLIRRWRKKLRRAKTKNAARKRRVGRTKVDLGEWGRTEFETGRRRTRRRHKPARKRIRRRKRRRRSPRLRRKKAGERRKAKVDDEPVLVPRR